MAGGHVWSGCVVSAHPGRNAGGLVRISPRADVRLCRDDGRLFLARLAFGTLDGTSASRPRRSMAGSCDPYDSGTGTRSGKALRGGNDGARLARERTLARLFDLLHACEYRRRARPDHRLVCPEATGPGYRKCVSRCGLQRLPDVLDHTFLVSGARTIGRTEGCEPFDCD